MKQWNGNNFRLGMLGGGQLGRMFIQEALNYDVHVHCMDPDPNAPCKTIASSFIVGSLTDYDQVMAFGKDKQVVTVEIENVNIEALQDLEKQGIAVFPQPRVLAIVQDKGLQKQFYADQDIPTADFSLVESREELLKLAPEMPFVLKLRKGGYDGKGVQIIRSQEDLKEAFDGPCIVEKMVPFSKELSVIVARNQAGETAVYPTVECEFSPTANLVEFLFSPADVSPEIEQEATKLALQVIDSLEMVGLLAVELFLTSDGKLMVNEIAPRPHNSGHHTIECALTSQFEQHMRSILNAPLGNTGLVSPGVMINLLGAPGYEGEAVYDGLKETMQLKGVKVHLYGKQTTKPFRKMGHVTIFGDTLEVVKAKGRQVSETLRVIA
ncbi:MAG: 5-(carboxyamino)imidazole ribonucleotide synthase [Candidatus Fluviicola riflensis]|nr:MAG: 5-(carboxyamino)imidazole ribonucleotide synthase [Candidatus Fluviicola riflensis]OGS83079.1 MAG: 5-(carboxyamino)imidazole ribonucleotide synthase [Fluviicola sp. RIFCSPHIGHO2_01_FULL_43_53]OGS88297.1 MAG: 5-(carboxyamino)imidazole ribonucleotide synthase [Fluviicola sp. RIFCSPHIGHO2_12_FULL_43_24]